MPRKLKFKTSIDQLRKTKFLRQYGITDLKKYMVKIRKNIMVFKEAIKKENVELARVAGMIETLKKDIKEIDTICSTTTS